MRLSVALACTVAMVVASWGIPTGWAQEAAGPESANGDAAPSAEGKGAEGNGGGKEEKKPDFPPIDEVTKEAEKLPEGMWQLYKKQDTLYGVIPSSQFEKPFMLNVSIAKGIGQGSIVAGMTVWEAPLYWKLSDKKIFLVEKNVRHTAPKNEPISSAVEAGFSDSIIAALPIKGKSGGNYLVDLGDFFFTDYIGLGRQLMFTLGSGYSLDRNRSTWGPIKTFPQNLTLQVAATYSGGAMMDIRTVADSRAVPISIHYDVSSLPSTGYKPRLADERMGYFLTALKDYSLKGSEQPFLRYVNRWHLEKADPKADVSPPKKPIVFYIEKSVPYEYRPIVREGILEWNKAFEKAGFLNAIEVRYQEDDAEWDAEDVRYNTIRWMTGEATYAIGPSRVNPETGQIYDADILVASSWLQYFEQVYENLFDTDDAAIQVLSHDERPTTLDEYVQALRRFNPREHGDDLEREFDIYRCDYARGFQQQLALAALAAAENGDDEPKQKGVPQEFIRQGLKELIMHEVGHTLGLRHNFKSSSVVSLDEMNDKEAIEKKGLVGSVMDYSLVNIAPEGEEQGYYFTPTLGPWDYLAIEYGYKPVNGNGEAELKDLQEIASRAAEPQHAYATDGDVMRDIDPLVNRRDMSDDPLGWAKLRAGIANNLWDGLVDRVVDEGDSFQKARTAFYISLSDQQQGMYFASRYIGGMYFNRLHKGDAEDKSVFEVVSYDKQKEALDFICQEALSDTSYDFDADLLANLAPNRWDHWGSSQSFRMDTPVHELVLSGQLRILGRLFSIGVLDRIHDGALYVGEDEDVFTLDLLYKQVTDSIFSELETDPASAEWDAKNPYISGFRRDLQRYFLKYFLLEDVLNPWPGMPQDARSVAWSTLNDLKVKLDTVAEADLDGLSQAHVRESQARVNKALDAAFAVVNY